MLLFTSVMPLHSLDRKSFLSFHFVALSPSACFSEKGKMMKCGVSGVGENKEKKYGVEEALHIFHISMALPTKNKLRYVKMR